MTTTGPSPRLYLELAAGDGAASRLEAALAAAPVGAVLLQLPASGEAASTALRALVTQAQDRSVAALIANDTKLARALGADGVHIAWCTDVAEAYAAARIALGPRAIVGAEAGRSRHDAMTLAESGADYIAFPRTAPASPEAPADLEWLDLVGWWAEVFEVPCVALGVTSPAEALACAAANAEFIGMPIKPGETAETVAGRVRAFHAALTPYPTASLQRGRQ